MSGPSEALQSWLGLIFVSGIGSVMLIGMGLGVIAMIREIFR